MGNVYIDFVRINRADHQTRHSPKLLLQITTIVINTFLPYETKFPSHFSTCTKHILPLKHSLQVPFRKIALERHRENDTMRYLRQCVIVRCAECIPGDPQLYSRS